MEKALEYRPSLISDIFVATQLTNMSGITQSIISHRFFIITLNVLFRKSPVKFLAILNDSSENVMPNTLNITIDIPQYTPNKDETNINSLLRNLGESLAFNIPKRKPRKRQYKKLDIKE